MFLIYKELVKISKNNPTRISEEEYLTDMKIKIL